VPSWVHHGAQHIQHPRWVSTRTLGGRQLFSGNLKRKRQKCIFKAQIFTDIAGLEFQCQQVKGAQQFLHKMKWSRDHVLTCSYMRGLDCSSLQSKCYYWQTKIFISSTTGNVVMLGVVHNCRNVH
jgi:hypothetical protein